MRGKNGWSRMDFQVHIRTKEHIQAQGHINKPIYISTQERERERYTHRYSYTQTHTFSHTYLCTDIQ